MAENILVLGSSNVDLIFRVPRFPRAGETLTGENLVTAFGGKGANQTMAAKRLGGKVRFRTKLGNDFFGHSYRRYLIQNGLEPRWLLRDKKLPNGIALIELIPGGGEDMAKTAPLSPPKSGVQAVGAIRESPLPYSKGGFFGALEREMPYRYRTSRTALDRAKTLALLLWGSTGKIKKPGRLGS